MFGKTGASATEMGTATHTVMQYLDFENCGDEAAVEAQVRLLGKRGTLNAQQAQMVNCGWIARFFETELGKKLRGPGQLLREFKFSILDDGENYDPALVEEKILLQGVVDCALVEPDGTSRQTMSQRIQWLPGQSITDPRCWPMPMPFAGSMAYLSRQRTFTISVWELR